MSSNKDQQIAALKAKVAEQETLIGELVRHQARVTGRSVEEYFDALKAREIVEALQLLLDKANAKVLKLQERQEKHRREAETINKLHALVEQYSKDYASKVKEYTDIEAIKKNTRKRMRLAYSQNLSENIELRKRVSELEKAHTWIPVGEQLPKPGVECLCITVNGFSPSGALRFGYYKQGEGWLVEVFGIDSHQPEEVTHWRPLPEPPKESEATQ